MKSIKNNEHQKQEKKDIKQKIMMFDRLGNECLTCHAPFDKMNKEQVKTWTVVVREKENKIHLYCPTCIEKAQQIIKDFKERKLNEQVKEKASEEIQETKDGSIGNPDSDNTKT